MSHHDPHRTLAPPAEPLPPWMERAVRLFIWFLRHVLRSPYAR